MSKKRKKIKKSKFRKIIIIFFILLLLGGFGMAYQLYSNIYQPNTVLLNDTDEYIYIPTGSNFDDVLRMLSEKGVLININSFRWVAKQKKYHFNIKSGRFKISQDFSNNDLVNLLRSGEQEPINITFNNIRTKEEFAHKVCSYLEIDSSSLLQYINDTIFLKQHNLNSYNVACLFIPNTYQLYWDISVKEFIERMIIEYNEFWNENRINLANEQGLSRNEVSILASIVEKEQNIKFDERPMIAGLYLNRIRKKMKLESDPTLIFALGDFSINRVLNKDKKVESIFNTYKHKGLPPGPICIPSINAIDAVLNSTDHSYIFMCAKEDFSGYHNFATTYRKHLRNARKYQKALNKRKIMR
tara:strand:+ start:2066 stop:3136 length:1071 start_codon:yes stop_codon:yes gene_type:complete